ncbi:MAG TPA: hypothetical protein ENH62_15915 [Marinobacter sp.]|uniref:Uncharacterized protein n=1 Tax=marine sediment metagenome TaxID=412755 RepID=A0A0F9TIR7_9ZZZZ|nr:hypothetical protein [Marinobacter sp.]
MNKFVDRLNGLRDHERLPLLYEDWVDNSSRHPMTATGEILLYAWVDEREAKDLDDEQLVDLLKRRAISVFEDKILMLREEWSNDTPR